MPIAQGPLAGRRIVITRTPEQSSILLRELEGASAEAIVLPCVEFRPPEDRAALDAALACIAEFDWVVLTSPNAAKFFCDGLRRVNIPPKDLCELQVRVAAIGASTRAAAALEGLNAELAAPDALSGKEFVSQFAANARGKKILLPQSDQATPDVAEGLRQAGAEVTAVVAYRTCMPESLDGEKLDRIRREGADAFVFASPSAVKNFARSVGQDDLKRFAQNSAFVAIGPTTAQAIREAGVPVKVEAAKPDSCELIKAMVEYFSSLERAKA